MTPSARKFPFYAVFALLAVATAVPAQEPGEFPGHGILPKEETGAKRFLDRFPDYDGRGIVVAIFDTGVDPGAPGLQVTTDGKPKIIDLVDGTGSGDVDTSTVAEAKGGALAGLSGRSLTIDPGWNNPSGEFHLGVKPAYELYPEDLVPRLKQKRGAKWAERQRAAVVALQRQLAAWDEATPAPNVEQKKERDELALQLSLLEKRRYSDPGPIFDCVVFHDGKVWRAAIDTDEDGDLTDEDLMTNFRLERQYDTFGDEDLLNYAVNIYEDGDILSIVADSGAHGTHCAGIVAANFPDQPERNGLAPGAQLISVKIGDTRLASASCGTGEVRGCVAVLENECDLINMSFGGPTADPNDGRTMEIYDDLVWKQGVIFVSSAGNDGPALSTAGSPGATTESLFGIGAYISPEMLEMQYASRETTQPFNYTFTSRGPTYDGSLGVKFAAPGGAIAPVPNWTLQGTQQMHGTSMASPNACGNIALMLSGLKERGIGWSPPSVLRAVENTCAPVEGVSELTVGRGLMQTDHAFDYFVENSGNTDENVRFDVRVQTHGGGRGIYLREPYQVAEPQDARIIIDPIFPEDAPNRAKVDYELNVRFEVTEEWIQCAEHLVMQQGGRRVDVRVDPTRLSKGAHYAEIRGFDATRPDRGPIFRVPVTVIRGDEVDRDDWTWRERIRFGPGYEQRHFLVVPEGATWADLRMKRLDENQDINVLVMQAVQLVPGHPFGDYGAKGYLRLAAGEEQVQSFKVVGGRVLELVFGEYTTYLGRGEIHAELTFHGIVPDEHTLTIDGSELRTRLNLETPLRKEHVAPSGRLTTLRRPIRPTSSEIRPLGGRRDKLPEERQVYELVLEYPLHIDTAGTYTPRISALNIADEKTWQSRVWMIFDSAKRRVATGWLEPGGVRLEKGDYKLFFHTRLDRPEWLEKVDDLVLMLDHPLGSPVGLSFHEDPDGATFGGGAYRGATLARGARVQLNVTAGKAPGNAKPGDLLIGSVHYGDENGHGDGHRPGGYPVVYVVPPKANSNKRVTAVAAKKAQPSSEERYQEALLEFKVKQLAGLRGEKDRVLFDQLVDEIFGEVPNHLPVLIEQLKRADGAKREEHLPAVVEAADRVIGRIDQTALAAHYGVNPDPDAGDAAKEMDEQKATLTDALFRKAHALFDLAGEAPVNGSGDRTSAEAFEAAWSDLRRWVDTTSGRYLELHIERERRAGRLAAALKLLDGKIKGDSTNRRLYEQRIELLDELGWTHWKEYEEIRQLIRFPRDYPPF